MTISLAIAEREASQKGASLRAAGSVPANVYGPKQDPISITVDAKELTKVLGDASESTIIELTGLKESIEVLVKEVDFDPVKRGVRHVDFYAIERGKEMTTNVALELVGEAPAEKGGIGSVTQVLREVEVTCMPSNLPSHIDVDISSLEDEHSKVSVADLTVPEGVTIGNEPEEAVVVISVAQEEEEEAPTEIDMDAIEVEEKGKSDDATEGGDEDTDNS
jgi:large subunit ribosomal protein L25